MYLDYVDDYALESFEMNQNDKTAHGMLQGIFATVTSEPRVVTDAGKRVEARIRNRRQRD